MKFSIPPQFRVLLGLIVFILGVAFVYKNLNPNISPARFFSIAILILMALLILWMQFMKKLAGQFLLDNGLRALNRNCDPETAIVFHTQKLEMARARGEKAATMLFLNNLAVAYHANGETEKALALLKDADIDANNPAIQMVHNGNMAVLNWDAGNYDEFWRCKAIVDNYVALLNNKSPAYQNICRQMERISARADILNANYEKALAYFTGQMQNIPPFDQYAKVSNMYIIAGIYYLMDDGANYRKSLEFVAQNGNKLHVAKLAREHLAKLG